MHSHGSCLCPVERLSGGKHKAVEEWADLFIISVPVDLHFTADHGHRRQNAGAAIQSDPVQQRRLLIKTGQGIDVLVTRVSMVVGGDGCVSAETERGGELGGAGQLEVPHFQFEGDTRLRFTPNRNSDLAMVQTGWCGQRNIYIDPDRLVSAAD